MEEIWKDIKGYEGLYQVSNLGKIKSIDRLQLRRDRWGNITNYYIKGKYIRYSINNKGYCTIHLNKNYKCKTYLLHRLVAKTFIENKNNYNEINHKDENKLNNCVDNLEWCSRNYNNNYGCQSKEGRRKSAKHRMKKVAQYDKFGNLIKIFDGLRVAEEKTGVHNRNICHCCKGDVKTAGGYVWKYVNESG